MLPSFTGSLLLALLSLSFADQLVPAVGAVKLRPRTSEIDTRALKAARSRQARSKDVVRRMREGPRRRLGGSPIPCAQSGMNLIQNGGFDGQRTGDAPAGWTQTTSGAGFSIIDNFGGNQCPLAGQSCPGLNTRGGTTAYTASIEQTVQILCAETAYTLAFDFGRADQGNSRLCRLTVTVEAESGGGVQIGPISNPCADRTCTDTPSNIAYASYSFGVGPFAAGSTALGPNTVTFAFECDGPDPNGTTDTGATKAYFLDNIRLSPA